LSIWQLLRLAFSVLRADGAGARFAVGTDFCSRRRDSPQSALFRFADNPGRCGDRFAFHGYRTATAACTCVN